MKNKSVYYSLTFLLIALSLGQFSILDIKLSVIAFVIFIFTLLFNILIDHLKITLNTTKNRLIFFLLFFWIYAIVLNTINGIDFIMNGHFITLTSNILITIIVAILINDLDDIKKISGILILALVINIALGLYNVISGIQFIDVDYIHIRYGNIPMGFYDNPNDYATLIFLGIIAIFLNLSLNMKNIVFKIMIVLIGVYLIYSNSSRGNLFGILVFISIFLTSLVFHKKIKRYHNLFMLIFLIVLFTLGYFIILDFESIISIFNIENDSSTLQSDYYRLKLITDGFSSIVSSFGLGTGTGTSIKINNINLHNMFLELAVEYGIIVGLGFVWLCLKPLLDPKYLYNKYVSSLMYAFFPSFIIVSISSSSILRETYMWVVIVLIYLTFEIISRQVKGKMVYKQNAIDS